MSETTAVVQQPQQQLEAFQKEGDKLTNLQRLAKLLAASGYFQDARDMAQAAVKVMAGEELGIPPIASMMGVNIIKGKVALGANLIASRIRAHGYDYEVQRLDDTGCVLVFKRGGKTLGESSFTNQDAGKAELTGKDNWKHHPRNMYFSRAISNGAKWYTPEIFGGAPVYIPEELGAEVDGEGSIVHQEHQTGSQEAADQVAREKLATDPAVAPAGLTPGQSGGSTGDPPPDPVNGGGVQASTDPPELQNMLAKMLTAAGKPSRAGCIEAFTLMKGACKAATGDDTEFLRIIAEFGMKNPSDLKGRTMGDLRQAIRDLWAFVAQRAGEAAEEDAMRKEAAEADAAAESGEYQATDADVPPNIGTQNPQNFHEPVYEPEERQLPLTEGTTK